MAFDILFLILCGIGFISGYRRGIVFMLFFVAALFLGTFATLKFSYLTHLFLENQFGLNGPYMPLLSLVITFVIVFAVILWLADFITKALKLVFLNSINRLVGGALGALAGAAVISIAAWYVHGLKMFPENFAENSNTFNYCLEFAPFVIEQAGKLVPFMSDLYEQLETMFGEVLNAESAEPTK